jgi:hypothetical protein
MGTGIVYTDVMKFVRRGLPIPEEKGIRNNLGRSNNKAALHRLYTDQ